MEFLKCKACGAEGMVPVNVTLADREGLGGKDGPDLRSLLSNGDRAAVEEESRFYSCHVCGDNWLSIRSQEDEDSRITFIHQMGVEPEMRRIAHMTNHIVLNEQTVEYWEYFLDRDEVDEAEWLDKLEDRRRVLRAICTN